MTKCTPSLRQHGAPKPPALLPWHSDNNTTNTPNVMAKCNWGATPVGTAAWAPG